MMSVVTIIPCGWKSPVLGTGLPTNLSNFPLRQSVCLHPRTTIFISTTKFTSNRLLNNGGGKEKIFAQSLEFASQ